MIKYFIEIFKIEKYIKKDLFCHGEKMRTPELPQKKKKKKK
jgi:hypothetical protein